MIFPGPDGRRPRGSLATGLAILPNHEVWLNGIGGFGNQELPGDPVLTMVGRFGAGPASEIEARFATRGGVGQILGWDADTALAGGETQVFGQPARGFAAWDEQMASTLAVAAALNRRARGST